MDIRSARGASRTVLHLIRTVHPEYGGPVEGLRQLIAAYKLKGWRIEVACLDAPDAPWLSSFPAPVHALGPGLGKYGFRLSALKKMKALVDGYSAVIVNGIWEFTGPMALYALAYRATPYYVFTHGMLDPWFKRRYPLKHVKKWLYWLCVSYWLLRNATAVFFTTEEEKILARRSFWLYRSNEVVVGYGTTAPTYNLVHQLGVFQAAFPEVVGKRNVLFLGRIHRKKGCELLITAFARIMGDKPEWHLIMAGPDATGWRPELEALALRLGLNKRITWTGALDGDLKWGAFRAADVFALPSHQENFGIAVAEALACSLPVLISNKVNIWREIDQWRAGVVEADDQEGMTALLECWAGASAASVAAMRAAALDCFNANFDIQMSSSRMIDVLEAGTPTLV